MTVCPGQEDQTAWGCKRTCSFDSGFSKWQGAKPGTPMQIFSWTWRRAKPRTLLRLLIWAYLDFLDQFPKIVSVLHGFRTCYSDLLQVVVSNPIACDGIQFPTDHFNDPFLVQCVCVCQFFPIQGASFQLYYIEWSRSITNHFFLVILQYIISCGKPSNSPPTFDDLQQSFPVQSWRISPRVYHITYCQVLLDGP